MKLKSIQTKTLISILPLALISMIIMTSLSYIYSKNIVKSQIEEKMSFQLDKIEQEIDKKLMSHNMVANSLARNVQSIKTSLTEEEYEDLIKNALSFNDSTYGAGVFYEPNKYQNGVKYFAPYVYKKGSNLVYTNEYSAESYNYTQYDWYTSGKSVKNMMENNAQDNKNGEPQMGNNSVWSEPYLDSVSNVSMVTTTVPFYDKDNAFSGVVTADMKLTTIQKLITKIKIGKSGRAFLLSAKGTYIADVNKNKIMKVNITKDSNKTLAKLGENIISKSSGNGTCTDNNGVNNVYYQNIGENGWKLVLVVPQSEIYSGVTNLMEILAIIAAIFSITIAIVIVIFSRYLRNSIKKVNELAGAIKDGDLTSYINVTTVDEFGQMSNNLNIMNNNLKEMVSNFHSGLENVVATSEELTASAEQTQSAAEQISSSIQEVAYGANEQNNITKDTLYKVQEIAVGIGLVLNSVQSIEASSTNAYKQAEDGNKKVVNVIEHMNDINEKVQVSTEIVNVLGKKSNEIGEIISVINDIADQTNLLSLNAAIEAARAGESGKGFAVVAEEVRKLAVQSENSTREIRNIIGEIQMSISNAVKAMSDGNIAVKSGMETVNNAGEAFNSILGGISKINYEVEEASIIVNEIHSCSEKIVTAVNQITDISEKNTSSSENVAAASEEQSALMKEVSEGASNLSEMAMTLEGSLSRFKM